MALGALGLAYASGALAADTSSGPGMPPPDFYEEMGKASRTSPAKRHVFTKAPQVAPAVDWTGYYIGADAGAAWASTRATWNPQPSPAAFGAFPISATDRGTGFVGGGHIGYNSQFAPDWVAGVEGDWMWTRAGGSFKDPWIADPPFVAAAGAETTMGSHVDWLASARGRFGYLLTPAVLAYATGGAAWARIDYTASNFNGLAYATSAAAAATRTGYTAGAGLEWALTCDWFVRAEYLFYGFGAGPTVIATTAVAPVSPSAYSWGHTTLNVARAGVSYKF
jgi:outer membrane immunogenic protein